MDTRGWNLLTWSYITRFPPRSKTSSCPVAVMRKLRQAVRLWASNTQGCIPREVERLRTDRNYPVNFRTSFFFVENFVIYELRELLFYCFFSLLLIRVVFLPQIFAALPATVLRSESQPISTWPWSKYSSVIGKEKQNTPHVFKH